MICLRDSYNRPINYLRISVTDRCNFRCIYCMPADGVAPFDHDDMLSYEEIVTIARAAADLGISKLRLTGGEPLARLGIVDLVRMLAAIPGIDDLALSTNGALLDQYARPLKDAGLRRINVSLDTMHPEKFSQFTRCGRLADVMRGIAAAEEVGLRPIKINTVAMRGMNDDELVEIAARTLDREWHIRFIELMPIGNANDWTDRFMSTAEILEQLAILGPLEPENPGGAEPPPVDGNGHGSSAGPARYYRLPGAKGTIGFISALSQHFCHECNRLRLTADGRLRPCLMWDKETDLRTPLRQGATPDELRELIARATREKPWGHLLNEGVGPHGRIMSEIGG